MSKVLVLLLQRKAGGTGLGQVGMSHYRKTRHLASPQLTKAGAVMHLKDVSEGEISKGFEVRVLKDLLKPWVISSFLQLCCRPWSLQATLRPHLAS